MNEKSLLTNSLHWIVSEQFILKITTIYSKYRSLVWFLNCKFTSKLNILCHQVKW